MSMVTRIVCLAFVVSAAVWIPSALAAQPAPAAPAEPHWHDVKGAWADAFHHPFDGLQMGLDLRLREVYTHNMLALDDQFGDGGGRNANDHHWQRIRSRWSTVWTLSPDVTFNTRLVWEFWTISSPDRHGNKALSAQDTDFREAIFDRMNIQWKNAFDAPMTVTVGRQDIFLGTGWLVGDGTPADGSRTVFFDAVRATIDLRDTTQLDLIGICQYDDESKFLQPINHRDYIHLTQRTDETGFIGYLTDKSFENTTLEGYYIYKKEEPSDWAKFSDSWWTALPGADAEIHTIGGRIAQKLDENWSYSTEVAKQFGKRDEETMKGLGTNNKLAYAFNDELKNELRLTHEYMSGNKPGTSANEKFDTLWGDYPQAQRGGDLQSYIWTYEGSLGEVSNLHRIGFGHTFKPGKEWTMSTDYNLMWADQNGDATQAPSGNLQVSDNSYFRGQMITGLLTYQCCKNFRTQFLVDYFIPGSYYDQSNRDHAIFARINMEWTF